MRAATFNLMHACTKCMQLMKRACLLRHLVLLREVYFEGMIRSTWMIRAHVD